MPRDAAAARLSGALVAAKQDPWSARSLLWRNSACPELHPFWSACTTRRRGSPSESYQIIYLGSDTILIGILELGFWMKILQISILLIIKNIHWEKIHTSKYSYQTLGNGTNIGLYLKAYISKPAYVWRLPV